MNDEYIKKIAQQVYSQNSSGNQFTVTRVPIHTHNGIDSQRIDENNLINGTTALLSLLSINSETLTVNTLQKITKITLTGIVADNLFKLTTALTIGATSATLAANWTQTTGSYLITFSDQTTQKTVVLTNGATTMTWTGGLATSQDAYFFEPSTSTTTCPQKAVFNGTAQIGKCYEYNFSGNITNIPTIGGSYEQFLQMGSDIYTDNSNILHTRVNASDKYLVYISDYTGTIVASIQIIKWTGTSIVFNITVAPQWQISWYLSMS